MYECSIKNSILFTETHVYTKLSSYYATLDALHLPSAEMSCRTPVTVTSQTVNTGVHVDGEFGTIVTYRPTVIKYLPTVQFTVETPLLSTECWFVVHIPRPSYVESEGILSLKEMKELNRYV